MIINDLDDYYIVFDTKNRNTELDTLPNKAKVTCDVMSCNKKKLSGRQHLAQYL